MNNMRFLFTTWRSTTTALLISKQRNCFSSSSVSIRYDSWFASSSILKRISSHKSTTFSLSSELSISTASSSSSEHDSNFATSYHAPVMWKECIEALLESERSVQRQKRQALQIDSTDNINHGNDDYYTPLIYVDGTLGGGGHSAALLERLQPGDVVLGCDVDPAALDTARRRLEKYVQLSPPQQQDVSTSQSPSLPLLIPVQCNFGDLAKKLPTIRHPVTNEPIAPDGMVDGILLDLGVSSYQIDTAERGFAFMKDGPLDMRMGAASSTNHSTLAPSSTTTTSTTRATITAADICNQFSADDLTDIFKMYGDEPRARTIARSILIHRPLTTTGQLREAVAAVIPEFNKKSRRQGLTATLARVFQSLRIVVNQEDEALAKALTEMCPTIIRPGGRLVVMSYHSMEDRAVKRIMKHGTIESQGDYRERDLYGNVIHKGPPIPWRPVGKLIKASEEEVAINPRARSATLRIAERI